LKLNVPGIHNIQNALAAVAVGLDLDIPISTILEALEEYQGMGRRFELKKTVGQAMIIEDYAHHPTELKATLEAAKKGWKKRTLAVFQPHRFSRLSLLMEEFAESFNQADVLIITEVYPAGEKPIEKASGQTLFEEIQSYGHKKVYFEKDMANIPSLINRIALPEDMILVLGAGNIYQIIPDIIRLLQEKKENGS
jgi:UDP-N-acetylmuramate--alanine ligase